MNTETVGDEVSIPATHGSDYRSVSIGYKKNFTGSLYTTEADTLAEHNEKKGSPPVLRMGIAAKSPEVRSSESIVFTHLLAVHCNTC